MDTLFSRKSTDSSLVPEASPNVSLNSSNDSQNRSGKEKEKKDSTALSFVKRLTKRSKSPSTSTAYSMDNPVFEDSSVPTTSGTANKNIHLSHPVHVR